MQIVVVSSINTNNIVSLNACFSVSTATSCDGEINAMVEGSKFRESHILKILSWRANRLREVCLEL